MKQAKPSNAEFEQVITFLQDLDDAIHDDNPDLAEWVRQRYPTIQNCWSRVLWAGKTAIDNSCDPTLDHLEWKPEIKSLMQVLTEDTLLNECGLLPCLTETHGGLGDK